MSLATNMAHNMSGTSQSRHWIGISTGSVFLWDLDESSRITLDVSTSPDQITKHVDHNNMVASTFPSGRRPDYPVTIGGYPAMDGTDLTRRMTGILSPTPNIGGTFTYFFAIATGAYDTFDRLLSAGGVFDIQLHTSDGRLGFVRTPAGGGNPVSSAAVRLPPSTSLGRGIIHYDSVAETVEFRTEMGSEILACAAGSTPVPTEVKVWGRVGTAIDAVVGTVPIYGLVPGGLSESDRDTVWNAMGAKFGL